MVELQRHCLVLLAREASQRVRPVRVVGARCGLVGGRRRLLRHPRRCLSRLCTYTLDHRRHVACRHTLRQQRVGEAQPRRRLLSHRHSQHTPELVGRRDVLAQAHQMLHHRRVHSDGLARQVVRGVAAHQEGLELARQLLQPAHHRRALDLHRMLGVRRRSMRDVELQRREERGRRANRPVGPRPEVCRVAEVLEKLHDEGSRRVGQAGGVRVLGARGDLHPLAVGRVGACLSARPNVDVLVVERQAARLEQGPFHSGGRGAQPPHLALDLLRHRPLDEEVGQRLGTLGA